MADATEIEAQLAEAKIRNRWQVRREFKALPEIVGGDEEVLTMGQGRYQSHLGIVVVTTRRVVFVDLGMARRRVADFPFGQITSVENARGFTTGKLIITVAGNQAVVDQMYPRERADEIGDLVRSKLDRSSAMTAPAASAPTAQPAATSLADEIRKLGELRNEGLLTDEEFEEQKRRLLEG